MDQLLCCHISDTHEQDIYRIVTDSLKHREPQFVDFLFISGDLTYRGYHRELKKIRKQFQQLLDEAWVRHIILTPGNHDVTFEADYGFDKQNECVELFKGNSKIHLLIHEHIMIEGISIFGSPWTPWFHDWAYNYHQNKAEELWAAIPDSTQILVTHGPPHGILDLTVYDAKNVGCPYLLEKVISLDKKELRYHLFGHIHEMYGIKRVGNIQFMNSSIMTLQYRAERSPQYFIINKATSEDVAN
jgi:Icc-related predicted phosphoesterase